MTLLSNDDDDAFREVMFISDDDDTDEVKVGSTSMEERRVGFIENAARRHRRGDAGHMLCC